MSGHDTGLYICQVRCQQQLTTPEASHVGSFNFKHRFLFRGRMSSALPAEVAGRSLARAGEDSEDSGEDGGSSSARCRTPALGTQLRADLLWNRGRFCACPSTRTPAS